MSGVLIAALVGVGIAVQVRVVGSSSSVHHPLSVSVSLQFAGALAGLVWVIVRNEWRPIGAIAAGGGGSRSGSAGGWSLLRLGYASARIGVAATLAVSIAAQLAFGLLLDARHTSSGAAGTAVTGALLVVVGTVLVAMS